MCWWVQLGVCCWMTDAHLVWVWYRRFSVASRGTRHTGCELGSCPICQYWAPHCPHSHQPRSSWHSVLAALTHMRQRVRSYREPVKKGCKNTGQVQGSIKQAWWSVSFYMQPTPFKPLSLSSPLCSSLLPLPLHVPSIIVHSSTDQPPTSFTLRFRKSGFDCSFLIAH